MKKMIYDVTYYRHDKKITESKPIKADTMALAVQSLIHVAERHGKKISSISCTIKGSNGVQRFCDICLTNEATYGVKQNKMLCKECRK